MIIADMSIWSQALRGQSPGLQSLFNDLRLRGELSAPGWVFAQLLSEAEDDRQADRLREWAADTVALEESPNAWIAAGDLHVHFAQHGIRLSLMDSYIVALCLREALELWSFNPIFDEVARLTALHRYMPTGM